MIIALPDALVSFEDVTRTHLQLNSGLMLCHADAHTPDKIPHHLALMICAQCYSNRFLRPRNLWQSVECVSYYLWVIINFLWSGRSDVSAVLLASLDKLWRLPLTIIKSFDNNQVLILWDILMPNVSLMNMFIYALATELIPTEAGLLLHFWCQGIYLQRWLSRCR